MLQSHEPDQCCGKHISKALRAEELDTAAEWTCPRCGVLWTATIEGTVKHWSPKPIFLVLR